MHKEVYLRSLFRIIVSSKFIFSTDFLEQIKAKLFGFVNYNRVSYVLTEKKYHMNLNQPIRKFLFVIAESI